VSGLRVPLTQDRVGLNYSVSYILNADGTRKSDSETELQPGGTTATLSTTWTYDALDRLTGETITSSLSGGSQTETWSYDMDGNRVKQVKVAGGVTDTTTYTYNGDDQMTQQVDSSAGTTTFGYDANGSQTSSTNGSTVTTYAYNVRNQLSSVTTGGVTTSYQYDDSGNRVSETTGGTTTYYLIDANNPTGYPKPIEQWVSTTGSRSTATLSMSYIIGDRVLAQANSSGAVSYLLVDGQDNTRALVNSSGAVTATFNYDAFGNPIGSWSLTTAPTTILFQQTMVDPASGLNFDGGREEKIGQDNFIEADPPSYSSNQNPITLNSHLLDNADAINVIDPSGHDGLDELLVGLGVATEIGLAILNSAVVTSLVQAVATVSLIEFAINPDFQQSIIAATGGDLTNLTEVFAGGVSYFANLGTVGQTEAESTAAFVSSFAPAAARGSDAVVLDVAAMRNFFLARGLSTEAADGFASSFSNGMGVLREVKAGETFLRYSDEAGNAVGSFLTKTAYPTPSQAVGALNLEDFNNGATLVQQVTATQDTYVLEGGVAGSDSNAYQAIAVDQSAFTYGPRVPTGSNPP
jgi:YD repeat-containing protein